MGSKEQCEGFNDELPKEAVANTKNFKDLDDDQLLKPNEQLRKGRGSRIKTEKLLLDENGVPIPMFQNLSNKMMAEIAVKGTGGKKDKVYKVVHDLIPQDLKHGLASDFTDYERHEIFHRIDIHAAETDHLKPRALWIFGPPAVGKSTVCNQMACDIFGRHHNAVTVDGSEFRLVHKGFQMVAQHGLRNDLLHSDAWEILKGTGCMDRLKEEVVELAIERRQHLKIPEVAANSERVNSMLQKLVDADYELHALCLWAPRSETEARGRARGVIDGKAFTTKAYDNACKSAVAFGQQWLEKIASNDDNYKSVMFYDNTVFPSRPVHFSEFKHLASSSGAEADLHALTCKESRAAGIKSELASSEARTQGRSRRSVIQAGLSAWLRHWTEDEPMTSQSVLDWGLRQPEQIAALARSERRQGHIEGVLAGICMCSAFLIARNIYQARS